MSKLLTTPLGRLRLLGFFEGMSLIILVFIGVPLKRMMDMPEVVQIVGPIHGVLFLGFVLLTIMVSISMSWKFTKTTWKVLLSSLIPFGTFYVDAKVLKPMEEGS